MSNLDDQLKELQLQKLRATFLKKLKEAVGNTSGETYQEIEEEVKDQIFSYFDSQIELIESGKTSQKQERDDAAGFSPEQTAILRVLADRAIVKQGSPGGSQNVGEPPESQLKPVVENKQDKIQFALAHRHLDGKEVKLANGATGIVTGLDAPNVVIKLTAGGYAQVPPEELIV